MKCMRKILNQKGFTLVELMVVIAILGVLAAIAVPRLGGSTDSAKNAKLKADLRTVDSAIMQYYSAKSAYPASTSDLSGTEAGKILAAWPKDAKGEAIVYTKESGAGKTGYNVTGSDAGGTARYSPGSNDYQDW